MSAPNFTAGGNISPSTIVTQVGQADFTVIQASSATVPLVGVVQDGTWDAPGVNGSASFAATVGRQVRVFGVGDECLCMAGDTITVGCLVKPDANGNGIPVTGSETTTTYYVGEAEEGTTGAGILFRLTVKPAVFHF